MQLLRDFPVPILSFFYNCPPGSLCLFTLQVAEQVDASEYGLIVGFPGLGYGKFQFRCQEGFIVSIIKLIWFIGVLKGGVGWGHFNLH